jgi:hypothetical protein
MAFASDCPKLLVNYVCAGSKQIADRVPARTNSVGGRCSESHPG